MASGPAHYAAAEESLARSQRFRVTAHDLRAQAEEDGSFGGDEAAIARSSARLAEESADIALQEAMLHALLAQAAAVAIPPADASLIVRAGWREVAG